MRRRISGERFRFLQSLRNRRRALPFVKGPEVKTNSYLYTKVFVEMDGLNKVDFLELEGHHGPRLFWIDEILEERDEGTLVVLEYIVEDFEELAERKWQELVDEHNAIFVDIDSYEYISDD